MIDIDADVSTVTWLGVSYRTILSAAETGGRITILESISPPEHTPPRHIHHVEDEIFVILSGRIRFWLDGSEFVRGEGETAFIPRGKEHSFKVLGTEPCRHLVILTPSGFEGFFSDMAVGQFAIPQDLSMIEKIAHRYDLTLSGPPLD